MDHMRDKIVEVKNFLLSSQKYFVGLTVRYKPPTVSD